MRETPDTEKLTQSARLSDAMQQFLSNGGKVTQVPQGVTAIDPLGKQHKTRMKFTSKADSAIGFTKADRPTTQLEMTEMSTSQKKTAAPAAKPAATKPAAAPVKTAEKSAVPRTVSINLAALTPIKNAPVPPSAGRSSEWVPVLLKLQPGDAYFIAGKTAANLGYVKKKGAALGIELQAFTTYRDLEDGKGPVQGCLIRRASAEDNAVVDESGEGDGLEE